MADGTLASASAGSWGSGRLETAALLRLPCGADWRLRGSVASYLAAGYARQFGLHDRVAATRVAWRVRSRGLAARGCKKGADSRRCGSEHWLAASRLDAESALARGAEQGRSRSVAVAGGLAG